MNTSCLRSCATSAPATRQLRLRSLYFFRSLSCRLPAQLLALNPAPRSGIPDHPPPNVHSIRTITTLFCNVHSYTTTQPPLLVRQDLGSNAPAALLNTFFLFLSLYTSLPAHKLPSE